MAASAVFDYGENYNKSLILNHDEECDLPLLMMDNIFHLFYTCFLDEE